MADDRFKGRFEKDESPIDATAVAKFHNKSDVDSSAFAHHHTLGLRKDQASSGAHTHKAGDQSKLLMEGLSVTGSKGGNVALANLISMLVANFGLTDNTT